MRWQIAIEWMIIVIALEGVRRTRRPVRVTPFGKPVVDVIPPNTASDESWLGCMRDSLEIRGVIVGPVDASEHNPVG